VTGVNVRRPQAGSTHANRGLRTTTSARPACGTSRTRCTLHACTRDDTTPHSGQPSSRSTGCTLTRFSPSPMSAIARPGPAYCYKLQRALPVALLF
jgi:hypothetical protein